MIKVVKCLKGKEKGLLFAVLEENEKSVLIANGKQRSLEKPKLKNKKHISDTGMTLEESWINTNRSLRKALRAVDL